MGLGVDWDRFGCCRSRKVLRDRLNGSLVGSMANLGMMRGVAQKAGNLSCRKIYH